jgi:4-amino-4-deoxy-L-arabinose transferase-like glycosyltransferase
MLMRADAVTPTLGGHTWFEKPALLYWMMILSYWAFGVSEWAARLGPVCSGLLTSLIVYRVGRCVERASRREDLRGLSVLSGAANVSSLGMLVYSRGASFDVIITMTVTGALACFLVSELEVDEKRRRRLLAGFYASVGASLLAKGLVGIVIPVGIVAAYFALQRRWPDRVVRSSAFWGIPLALIVAAVWYVPVTMRHGWTFVDQFFIQHHFARFVSNKYHHPQPFYFYAPIMAIIALPWTVFLATALAAAPRWNWRAPTVETKFRIFALAWLVVPIVFFSFSESKLPAYVLPALPGAALLVGEQLARFLRDEGGGGAMRVTGAVLLLLPPAGMIYVVRGGYISTGCAITVALPLACAGALALVWTRRRSLCVGLTACAILAASACAIDCAVDRLASRESMRDLIKNAASRGYAQAPVFQLHTIERSVEFYAAGRLAYDASGEPLKFEGASQVADAAQQSAGPVLVVVPLEYVEQLTEYRRVEAEVIGDNGKEALVAVRIR